MSDARTRRVERREAARARQHPPTLVRCYPLGEPPRMELLPLRPGSETTIGRGDGCSLHIEDEAMSRLHARLLCAVDGSAVTFVDCESANGSFVDGVRVARAELRGGEMVRCGMTLLRVIAPGLGAERQNVTAIDRGGVGGPALRRVYELLERATLSSLAVLIEGESGTGKELAARFLHDAIDRPAGAPFVAVNCAAIPRELVESELFGHVRGAFTGATTAQEGMIRRADGGTLFLDEIGELPLEAQAKLLRVLQEHRVRPVGSDESIAVDLRVVSATNRDLGQAVVAGSFRPDLYARVGGLRVVLPPLRERREDIPLLVEHFVRAHGGDQQRVTVDALEQLCCWPWPLNIRQLESAVQRALLLADGADELDPSCFPRDAADALAEEGAASADASAVHEPHADGRAAAPPTSEPRQAQRLREALERHQGDINAVADELGISRSQLYRRAKSYGIRIADYRS
ncbi:MAG: sigma 54-interacting transcriptional regulator [Myxococcales bacterium]|nr:sigma 54-interacting transcriptional regulator [Myxococcales bacterium]